MLAPAGLMRHSCIVSRVLSISAKILKFMPVWKIMSSYISKENRVCAYFAERVLYASFYYRSTSWQIDERIQVYILCAKFLIHDRQSKSLLCSRSWNDEKMKIEEECTAYEIFSQVWRTSRHNRAKCGTSDHPSVSILMVIGQPNFARFSNLYQVFILKTESCYFNY